MVVQSVRDPGQGKVICPKCWQIVAEPTDQQRSSWETNPDLEYIWNCPQGHSGRYSARNATWGEE